MKITIIFIIFLINYGFSQKNTIYIYKAKKNEILKNNNTDTYTNNKVVNLLNKGLNAVKNLEYHLIYNNYESVFKIQDVLLAGSQEEIMLTKLAEILTSNGVYYQNLNENITLRQLDVFGESFLISEPLVSDWEITNMKKNIGKYVCFKALKKCISCDNSNITEVWFTPEVPVPFGPKGLGGLPGIILEVKMKTVTLFLDRVLQNQSDIIIKPNKGKLVSLEEYKKIAKEIRSTR